MSYRARVAASLAAQRERKAALTELKKRQPYPPKGWIKPAYNSNEYREACFACIVLFRLVTLGCFSCFGYQEVFSKHTGPFRTVNNAAGFLKTHKRALTNYSTKVRDYGVHLAVHKLVHMHH